MVKPPRFHTKPLRRKHSPIWHWIKTALGVALLAGIVFLVMRMPVFGGEWEEVDTRFAMCGDRRTHGCVVDGDTIMLGARKIRMAGYNAPEIDGECEAERLLARKARSELLDWVNQGGFVMDGGVDPPHDRYRRELRALKRGNQWLSDHMVEQELGRIEWFGSGGSWCE